MSTSFWAKGRFYIYSTKAKYDNITTQLYWGSFVVVVVVNNVVVVFIVFVADHIWFSYGQWNLICTSWGLEATVVVDFVGIVVDFVIAVVDIVVSIVVVALLIVTDHIIFSYGQ